MFLLILQLLCAVFTYCLVDIVISIMFSNGSPLFTGTAYIEKWFNFCAVGYTPPGKGVRWLYGINSK